MSQNLSALELFLNRYGHPVSECRADILAVLQQTCPNDAFSLVMWGLGTEFYENKLNGIVPPGGSVLDVGCGAGTWTMAASTIAEEVIAVDVYEPRIAAVTKMAAALQVDNIKAQHGDIFSLQAESNSFDTIICFNTLQLIKDYDAVLQEAYRLLKPGGKFYCSMADWGIIMYYLWESLHGLAPGKIANVIKCLVKSQLSRLSLGPSKSNYYNGVYLRDQNFLREAHHAGFLLVEDATTAGPNKEIYPKVFWMMPFFNEYVLKKSEDAPFISQTVRNVENE